MTPSFGRRAFVSALSAAAPAALWPRFARASEAAPSGPIRLGCAAITWGDAVPEAIADIAGLGYKGIQLRADALHDLSGRPLGLAETLAEAGLTFVALSSGALRATGGGAEEALRRHVEQARFVQAAGGASLEVTDERPRGRATLASDYEATGALLTEIGRRTAEVGIRLGYHNRLGSLGDEPRGLAAVLAAADPRYVHLVLDVGGYHQAGGDPAQAILEHRERLLFLHVEDVQSPRPGHCESEAESSYRFVELGRGQVDFPGVFRALDRVRFRGWAVVELDAAPDGARTARESAALSKRYLEERLGLGS
jgi:inosose dehydratase